eukprot:jgi/Ulvmu1/9078/UM005_0173.1
MNSFKKRIAPVSASTVHGIGGKDVPPAAHLSGLTALPGTRSPERKSVLELLSASGYPFKVVKHAEAYCSQLVAKEAHVSGNAVGKAVLVELSSPDKAPETVMCVLRAPDHVELHRIAVATGFATARVLSEAEARACTEKLGLDVDTGAVPAVPALYGWRAFMDAALARDDHIYFNAGRHQQLVRMTMADYRALAAPRVLPFAQQLDLHIREVKTLLTKAGRPINYRVHRHAAVVTAAETARELGLPGCAVVKAVAVKVDGKPVLCALCCHQLLDLERVEKLAGASSVELATPRELRDWFPNVEEGAIPPFGSMFGIPLFLDADAGQWPSAENARIAFNAGSYSVAISMSFADYLAAVRATQEPLVAHFAQPAPAAPIIAAPYLRQRLRDLGVPFESVRHGRAFTASQTAADAHIPGKCLAKPVIVRSGEKLAMAVVGADEHLDVAKLGAMVASGALEGFTETFVLAAESEFADILEHVETGAMPAFGNMCDMVTVVDYKLAANEVVYTNAGTHKELFKLAWADYQGLVKPIIGDITARA